MSQHWLQHLEKRRVSGYYNILKSVQDRPGEGFYLVFILSALAHDYSVNIPIPILQSFQDVNPAELNVCSPVYLPSLCFHFNHSTLVVIALITKTECSGIPSFIFLYLYLLLLPCFLKLPFTVITHHVICQFLFG